MGLAVVLFLQSHSANPSPVPGLLLILAVAGAIVDWRYIRKGGKPSSRRDKILFWSVTGVIVLFLTVLGFMGANAEGIGAASFQIALLLFALWELGRWRMRRKYPLLIAQKSEQPPPK